MGRTWRTCLNALSNLPTQVHRRGLVPIDSSYMRGVSETEDACVWHMAHALSVSVAAVGWRETSLRDCASTWSSVRLTEGRSGRERWVLSALDELRREERSEVVLVDIVWSSSWRSACLMFANGSEPPI